MWKFVTSTKPRPSSPSTIGAPRRTSSCHPRPTSTTTRPTTTTTTTTRPTTSSNINSTTTKPSCSSRPITSTNNIVASNVEDVRSDETNERNETIKRKRVFRPTWAVGRPWLKHTAEFGMTCQWCKDFKEVISRRGKLKSLAFINGCNNMKHESIIYHEKSAGHLLAKECFNARKNPEKAPAQVALLQLNLHNTNKLKMLFRNAHALSKHRKSFRDYKWLCDLDEKKGLAIGQTYRNDIACKTFVKYIAESVNEELQEELKNVKFFSITTDGATDSGISEQEIVFIRYCKEGLPITKFVGIQTPSTPDADGIFHSVLRALRTLGLDESDIENKMVGFGCDGASVMLGSKGGVSAMLKSIQPSLVTVHCFAHRLELSYKDSVKQDALYDSSITLLMGLYYYYHNSPKQRQILRNTFRSMDMTPIMPTRVGGTRWVGHMVLAITNFLRGYKAIRAQLENCIAQRKQAEAQNKARGYVRLMKRPDVIGYIHLLLDVLKPLQALSLTLQSNDTTLSDVGEKLDVTIDIITSYKESDGPNLSKFYSEFDSNLENEQPATYKEEPMSGRVNVNVLSKSRTSLSDGLLGSISKRFIDVSEGVIGGTMIANFKRWPVIGRKGEINAFGTEEIKIIHCHFKTILEANAINVENVLLEWNMLKAHLYNRYKGRLQKLTWPSVYNQFNEDHPNIMEFISLITSIPASSAENERGFNLMKLTKTNVRSRLKTENLQNSLTIQLSTPSVSLYDPERAIQKWLEGGKRARRPEYMDGVNNSAKRSKLDQNNVEESEEEEEEIEEESDEELYYEDVNEIIEPY